MFSISKINKDSFAHYLELPPELRMMIIDEMLPDVRCIFAGCSRSSYKYATSSKKWVQELSFCGFSETLLRISVVYSNENYKGRFRHGFVLEFRKYNDNKKYMKYLVHEIPEKELWKIEMHSSTDLVSLATQHFKQLLQCYQNTIKTLGLLGDLLQHHLKSFDFGIKSLNNLEILSLNVDPFKARRLLSIIRRTLKVLTYQGCFDYLIPKEIWEVCDRLSISRMKLNKQQFLQLSASFIEIHIGYLTENDIFDIVKSWQNGTIGKENFIYLFHIDHSNFDVKQLFLLFGVDDDLENKRITLKHHKEDDKTATLSYGYRLITFVERNIEK